MGTKQKSKVILFLILFLSFILNSCANDNNYRQPYSLNRDSNYIKEKLYVNNVASKMLKMFYINFGSVFEGRESDIVEIVVDTLLIKGNKILAFPVIISKNDDYYNPYAPQDFLNENSHFMFRLCPLIGYRDTTNRLWKLFPFIQITYYGPSLGVRGITKEVFEFLDSPEYTNNGLIKYINGVEQKNITPYKYKLSDTLFWSEKNIIWQKGFQYDDYYLFEHNSRGEALEVIYPDSVFMDWYLKHKFPITRER